jgi:hypothetical protein
MQTFTIAPSEPPIAQLRADCAAQIGYTPAAFNLLDREDDPAFGVDASDAGDTAIMLGDLVRYAYRGYGSFDGTVTAIDEAGRVEVEMSDEFGVRKYWCVATRLTLLMKRAAWELQATPATGAAEVA